jgi:hypothetical protein
MRTLVTFGLGALAMYLFDPQHGRRRRALIRDRVHARTGAVEARRAIRTGPEAGRASQTPQGAQHLGR